MGGVLALLAFAAGLGLTVQVGMNAALRTQFGSAGAAALVNFLVGIAALSVYLVAMRTPVPTRAALAGAPWWAWLGGLFGAFYVAIVTVAGPKLGATVLLAVTVFGQLLAALIVDQNGWLGFPQQPVTLARVAGCALLIGGVWLVSRG
ncbi:MAG: DMT family transporter [Steroidobacteraceae bacterium]